MDRAWISRPMSAPERLVDELVAGDRPQAGELRRDDLRGEVRVVVGFHAHRGAGQVRRG